MTKGLGRFITITLSEGNYHPQRMSDSSMGKRSLEIMMDTEKSPSTEESMVSRLILLLFFRSTSESDPFSFDFLLYT